MRIQDLLIGLLVLVLFMLVILGFATKMYVGMGVTLDNDTDATLKSFEDTSMTTKTNMYGVVMEMQNNSIGGSNVQVDSSQTSGNNIIGTGIRVVTLASRSFSIIDNIMRVISSALPIDPIFRYTFYAIIVVVVIMIFASSVLYNRL